MAVALVGRRVEMLHETRAAMEKGVMCLVLPGDVTVPEVRRQLHESIASEWGRLDVLVNNAGIVAAGPLAGTDDATLERLMATNVIAPIALTRDMLPLLRTASPARVVNIGSMFGDIGFPLFAAYSASKFGLRGLSAALRRELKCFGIGVTYVAPRGAHTDATRAVARFVEPFGMSFDASEAIARAVWDAVARGRNNAYPRGRERLFLLAERLFPSLVDRALAAQLATSGARRLIEEPAQPREDPAK